MSGGRQTVVVEARVLDVLLDGREPPLHHLLRGDGGELRHEGRSRGEGRRGEASGRSEEGGGAAGVGLVRVDAVEEGGRGGGDVG